MTEKMNNQSMQQADAIMMEYSDANQVGKKHFGAN